MSDQEGRESIQTNSARDAEIRLLVRLLEHELMYRQLGAILMAVAATSSVVVAAWMVFDLAPSLSRLSGLEAKVDDLRMALRQPLTPVTVDDHSTQRTTTYLLARLENRPLGAPSSLRAADLLRLLQPLVDAGEATPKAASTVVSTVLGDLNEIAVDVAKKKLGELLEKPHPVAPTETQSQEQTQICMLQPTTGSVKTNEFGKQGPPPHPVPRYPHKACPVAPVK